MSKISAENKKEVISLFLNTNENSSLAIATALNLKHHQVSGVISRYLNGLTKNTKKILL